MHCPICNNDTKVLESRTSGTASGIRRRRECLSCQFRFSTIEEMEILDLTVEKQTGATESYSREKIITGLKRALQKRQFEHESFKKLISDIEREIQATAKNNCILSEKIGAIVMKHLKTFDTVAYVRFASVYRDFKDPVDFSKEVKHLTTK